MTRGRKAGPDPVAPTDVLNHEALAADSAALTEIGRRSAEVAERFGDGQPYDRHRAIAQATVYMAQGAEAMLGLGKCLIELKENEEHGEFTRIVGEVLGIGPRSAQLMMQAALKYLSPRLESKAKSISHLGATKLFDLMAEPDESLEALTEGGTVAGLELDDIAAMSTRELRAALKAERDARTKDKKAKQRVIDGKESKLTKLEEQLARRESAEPAELEQYQFDSVRDAATEAELAIRHLVGQAHNVVTQPSSEAAATAARHAVEFVAQVLAGLIAEAGLPVDFTEMVTPHWLAATADAAAAASKSKKR